MDKLELNKAYSEEKITLKDLIEGLNNENPRFFMFGIPTYNNLGDQAIAYAEKRFFEKYYPEIEYIEITEPQTSRAVVELKDSIRKEDCIGYTGGGNIGSLYLNHEKSRRKVFESFPNHKTISFPQSVFFEENEHGENEKEKSRFSYHKNSNLTLVARESQTRDTFNDIFNSQVIYMPDIVLSLGSIDFSDRKREGVLFVLREDAEKVTEDSLVEELTDYLENRLNHPIEQTDTLHPHKIDDGEKTSTSLKDQLLLSEREELVAEKFKEIASSKLVVTDRLHGMIFSVITGTPCLVFDNSYGKASTSYFDWLKDLNYVIQTDEKDLQKLVQFITKLMDVKPDKFDLENEFKPLKEWIETNLEEKG